PKLPTSLESAHCSGFLESEQSRYIPRASQCGVLSAQAKAARADQMGAIETLGGGLLRVALADTRNDLHPHRWPCIQVSKRRTGFRQSTWSGSSFHCSHRPDKRHSPQAFHLDLAHTCTHCTRR